MLPKVIIHNSLSLDGSFLNFDVNLDVHYGIALQYKADAHLIGSATAKAGFEQESSPEEPGDFRKPKKTDDIPLWVIIDTKGILHGMLHVMRRFEYCRDIIVLVSKTTPEEYLQYLDTRQYDHYTVGDTHVDLEQGLSLLSERYGIATMITDCGAGLAGPLLDQGLVDEISLLVHPVITGSAATSLFSYARQQNCVLEKSEVLDSQYIWNVYRIGKGA